MQNVTKSKALPASFKAMGAHIFEEPEVKRLILTIDGEQKSGKTRLLCSAPDPIAFFSFDRGLDGVIQKWAKKKAIGVFEYNLPTENDVKKYRETWNKFHKEYYAAVANPDVRTICIDKGGDCWDLLRMAMLGAFLKIPSLSYTECNTMFRQLFRSVKAGDKNLLVTHELEKDYQNLGKKSKSGAEVSEWTGKYKRDGFQKLGFLVDSEIQSSFDPDRDPRFQYEVIKCGRDMDLVGDTLGGAECTFTDLAELIYGEPYVESEWRP